MLSNYHTLRLLAVALNRRIAGAEVTSLFSQERDELVLQFRGEDTALIVTCRGEENTFFLHPGFVRARRNTVNLLPGAVGRTIAATTIDPSDRVVRIGLTDGLTIVLLLYSTKANVLLVDHANRVIDALRNATSLRGTTVAHQAPEVVHDLTAFRERLLHRPSSPLLQAVKFTFPTFGTILALEALHRAAIPAEAIAGDVSSDAIDTFLTRVPGLLHDLSHPSPRTYMTPHGTVKLFSPIALTHVCEPREVLFDDIHDAIRFAVYRRRSARGVDDRKEAVVSILREQLRRAQRSAEAIEQELATGSRATEYERFGTLILHHLHELTPGAESLDIQEGTLQVSVPLEPRVPPTHSAQRYFERAKHARLAEQESRKRLAHLRSRISVAESLIADLSPAGTVDEFATRLRRHQTALQQFGLSQQGQPVELPPFRVFRVDGGFEVWAGKNSTNNDLLTLRYARPNDLWFHARGAGGSHVVLRVSSASGEPGRRAREQAAGIAAYYSKMRNARMVPVVVTERKFVRKPKGAPPGTVVLQREDVIFAEPRLPEGSPSSGS